MKYLRTCSVLILLLTGILFSCKKDKPLSDIPEIYFMDYYKVQYQNSTTDSALFLRVHFRDGDGDIGLTLRDTTSPYRIGERFYNNVFVEYLPGKNGVYSYQLLGNNDTLNYNDRITNLQPDTRDKSIDGVLTLRIRPIIGSTVPDSILFYVQLADRALHLSNKIAIGPVPVTF